MSERDLRRTSCKTPVQDCRGARRLCAAGHSQPAMRRTRTRVQLVLLALLHFSALCDAFSAMHARTAAPHLLASRGSPPAVSTALPAQRRPRLPVMGAPPAIPQLTELALLQPALLPIVSIIAICLMGMVPSGLKVIFSTSSRRQLHRRVFTGFTLGVLVSLWIFSGTWAFLSVFAGFAIVAQNEYYYMARENGCYPTWKLGLIGSFFMYVTACSANSMLRDALFPITGTVTIVYLMLRQERRTPATSMNDIATTFVRDAASSPPPRRSTRCHILLCHPSPPHAHPRKHATRAPCRPTASTRAPPLMHRWASTTSATCLPFGSACVASAHSRPLRCSPRSCRRAHPCGAGHSSRRCSHPAPTFLRGARSCSGGRCSRL